MYKYHSVQELAQLLEQHWQNTDEFQLEWKLDSENDQIIHFKIVAHGEVVRETTCDIYTIEIKTYDLEHDVQEWFRDPWYDDYTRANIALPSENGRDIELGDKVMVSDPCYDLDIWCQGVLENVKPGTWHTKAENLNVNCWGNRCSALIAWHEDVEKPNDFEETDIRVGVDSGQAGIYDYDHFAHIKDDEERDERWYDSIQTFFAQFNNEFNSLSNFQEPIYQEADDDENLFGFRYKMNDYKEHQLRQGAFGPEYPRSRMLGLTDRINLARLTN